MHAELTLYRGQQYGNSLPVLAVALAAQQPPESFQRAGYAMSASTIAGSKHFKMFGVLWRPDARSPSCYLAASPSFSRDFEPTNCLVMSKLALRESITLYI